MGCAHAALARCSVRAGRVRAHWLCERDHPWLSDLIERCVAFVGEPRRRLAAEIAGRSDDPRAGSGLRLAVQVLERLFESEVRAAVPPRKARAAVFEAAAGRAPRAEVLAAVAQRLGVGTRELEDSLLADLPGERRLKAPEAPVHAATLALRCNLAIAQAALQSSSEVAIELEGNARAIVRHARLRGLICTATPRDAKRPATLAISGPLALFRRTSLYGRHLAELVPLLAWSRGFRLEARCVVRGEEGRFVLRPTDPILPAKPPRLYDSRLERRFAREFARATADWELVREPEPLAALGTLVFPDFAITHRRDPARRWLLEIVGFWTADYVRRKLAHLRAARVPRLIVCLDAARDCGDRPLPPECPVLRFRRRIDPADVLRIIEG